VKAQGVKIGRFQVRSVMRRQSLRGDLSARFSRPCTTNSRHGVAPSPNLLLDEKNVARDACQVIIGDITYLTRAAGRWSYLTSWQDKFTKRIVGRAVADRMTDELLTSALAKAIRNRSVKAGTIIHTDQGSQYVSHSFRSMLNDAGCRQSMSRRATVMRVPCGLPAWVPSYDNATAESFFSRYKAEHSKGACSKTLTKPEARPSATSRVTTTGTTALGVEPQIT
jgi:transposase InsO family protein